MEAVMKHVPTNQKVPNGINCILRFTTVSVGTYAHLIEIGIRIIAPCISCRLKSEICSWSFFGFIGIHIYVAPRSRLQSEQTTLGADFTAI